MATDKARLKEITDIIKIHCNIAFDDNYYKTTKGLINKLKKNKEFSMDSGKVEGWISGLLYVVGEDSNLFDTGNWMRDKIYLSKTDLANGVGVSVSTMRSRASQIREALPENAKFIADIKDIYINLGILFLLAYVYKSDYLSSDEDSSIKDDIKLFKTFFVFIKNDISSFFKKDK